MHWENKGRGSECIRKAKFSFIPPERQKVKSKTNELRYSITSILFRNGINAKEVSKRVYRDCPWGTGLRNGAGGGDR